MVLVFENCSRTLGRVVAAMKSAITKIVAADVNLLVAANVNSQRVDLHQPLQIWQWNYYEHVIRSEKALKKIREYIQNNPEAEKIDFEKIYCDGPNSLEQKL